MPTKPMELTGYGLNRWISKLPGSFEIYWVKRYLVNVVLFVIKDLYKFEMTVKLNSNVYVGPVNVFS